VNAAAQPSSSLRLYPFDVTTPSQLPPAFALTIE